MWTISIPTPPSSFQPYTYFYAKRQIKSKKKRYKILNYVEDLFVSTKVAVNKITIDKIL